MKYLEKCIFRSFQVTPKDLSMFRVLFCLYILFCPGLPSFTWLGNDLNYFFNPPKLSFANLVSGFPSRWFFFVISLANLFSFFFIFWGLKTKWSSIVFSCTFIIGCSFAFSFGKIDHGVLQFYVPLFMSLLGWGDYYSLDYHRQKKTTVDLNKEREDKRTIVFAIFAMLIGFGFFTSGLLKIYGGWWKWDSEGARYWLYNNYYGSHRTRYLASYVISIDNHLFWKIQDYTVLLFELGFVFSAIHIRIFRYFLASAVVFHFLVMLIFNITFSGNLIAYLAFIDWAQVRNALKQKFPAYVFSQVIRVLSFFSVGTFLFWVTKLVVDSPFLSFPSLMRLFFQILNYPNVSEVAIFVLSIPILILLIYLHSMKPSKSLE